MKKISVLVLLVSTAALAQFELHSPVEGEILAGPGVDLSWLTVRLRGQDGPGLPVQAHVDASGKFQLEGVPNGAYVLQVLDAHGNEIMQQSVTVSSVAGPLSLRLPEIERPSPGGGISAARLLHRPDKRAVRAALTARKLSAKHDYGRAARELEKAIAFDPRFPEAYNNLGAQYMRLGRRDDAIAAFRRAVDLDPGGPQQQTNLAVVLAKSGQFEEAEVWARGAVRLDGANPVAQSVLRSIVAARQSLRDGGHLPVAAAVAQ